ncbi:hypothetical protein [Paenibacillus sp. ISL-20]|uniref:hypothetical protein n=1 Tax=Paenibacillus sp. ISL-20 TaxID=2819163 RepID=UPI001BE8D4A7|nr:hypothetical protein [Paenibacillus sp. ISL-20]MBT2761250.1 hypothetical protein [Paenibacillus sp. ISL-20]
MTPIKGSSGWLLLCSWCGGSGCCLLLVRLRQWTLLTIALGAVEVVDRLPIALDVPGVGDLVAVRICCTPSSGLRCRMDLIHPK